jgi:endonuclease/exonuclease/phosphatase family metal-dependent hydrolase
VHLSLDAAERKAHAATILQELSGDEDLVVAGDLNESVDGPAWLAIAGRLRVVSADAPTFPARNPRHRLDAIFVSPRLAVTTSGPVELDPADLASATDHLPVWVDLDLAEVALS